MNAIKEFSKRIKTGNHDDWPVFGNHFRGKQDICTVLVSHSLNTDVRSQPLATLPPKSLTDGRSYGWVTQCKNGYSRVVYTLHGCLEDLWKDQYLLPNTSITHSTEELKLDPGLWMRWRRPQKLWTGTVIHITVHRDLTASSQGSPLLSLALFDEKNKSDIFTWMVIKKKQIAKGSFRHQFPLWLS